MIRIAVLDDHPIVWQAIEIIAGHEEDFVYVGRGADGASLDGLLDREPDILLLDVRLESEDGLALCERAIERDERVRVLIFTGFGSSSLLARALNAGASGYLLKDAETVTIVRAIRQLADHGSYIDPRLELRGLSAGRNKEAHLLTSREVEVLRQVVGGATNREIAAELFVSPHTVKFHIDNLMTKLGVRRRAELVRVALERMLI